MMNALSHRYKKLLHILRKQKADPLTLLLLLIASLFILSYVYIAFSRISYPYELEWLEGASLEQVFRIREGHMLYDQPSLDFIPLIYTPLYFYLSAVVSFVLGINFITLRIISFTASIISMILIFKFVKNETKNTFLGYISVGMFAAMYRISGAWMDIGRVDSLFLMLLLTHLYVMKYKTGKYIPWLNGLLFTLCFLTKQTALIILPFSILYYFFYQKKVLGQFLVGLFFSLGGSLLLLAIMTNNWFNYYIFAIPQGHGRLISMFYEFWTVDILKKIPLVFLLGISYVAVVFGKSKLLLCEIMLLLGGLIGLSWLGRINVGGYDNVLLPGYAAFCILLGISVSVLGKNSKISVLKSFILGMILFQFGLLIYNPQTQIPSRDDKATGDRLVTQIAGIKGEVLSPYSPYLLRYAGKKSHFFISNLMELNGDFGGKGTDEGKLITAELDKKLKHQAYSAIILNGHTWYPSISDISAGYVLEKNLMTDESFYPKTGMQTRPSFLFVPIKTGK